MEKMVVEFDKRFNHERSVLSPDYKITKSSTLMNHSRCGIYEYLCVNPCSSTAVIAKSLKLSGSSVRWHLKRLVTEKLAALSEDGNTVFFPLNMISPEHTRIFKLLALERSGEILALIRASEGLSQKELCKALGLNVRTVMKHTSELESVGLIKSVSDGKYKRYYLTSLIADLQNSYRKRSKYFKEYILRKVKQDGLKPKILLSTPELLRLKLALGKDRRVLTVPTNPFIGRTCGLRSMRLGKGTQKNTLIPLPRVKTLYCTQE